MNSLPKSYGKSNILSMKAMTIDVTDHKKKHKQILSTECSLSHLIEYLLNGSNNNKKKKIGKRVFHFFLCVAIIYFVLQCTAWR